MRAFICMSLFGLCLSTMIVSADPVGPCCNLNGLSPCEVSVPANWAESVDPGYGSYTQFPPDVLSCAGMTAAPNAEDEEASKALRCGQARILKKEDLVIGCTGNNNSKTGSKGSSDVKPCRSISRCAWDAEKKACETVSGYPKYYNVQYTISAPNCSNDP